MEKDKRKDISTFCLEMPFLDFWTQGHSYPGQHAALLSSFKGELVVVHISLKKYSTPHEKFKHIC